MNCILKQCVIENNTSLALKSCTSVDQLSPNEWNKIQGLPQHLQYDFLYLSEKSGINELKPLYLSFRDGASEAARVNAYEVCTDISSLDTSLPGYVRNTIKRWYPNFMNFKVLETGHFTMEGNGIYIPDPKNLSVILPFIEMELSSYSSENNIDIQLIKDISPSEFPAYQQILGPLGFLPAMGFANTVLPILWDTPESYYQSLKKDTRKLILRALKNLKEEFGIETHFTMDYREYTIRMLDLWMNVHRNAKEYFREYFNQTYFDIMENRLKANSEALLFMKDGKLIAFNICFFDEASYSAMYWGVDTDFELYRKADLFKATSALCLERAIERHAKVFNMGITNYDPKLFFGSYAEPMIYFIRHFKKPEYTKTLANLLNKNINQPDNESHHAFKEKLFEAPDLAMVQKTVRKAINPDNENVFDKISTGQKANEARLSGLYNLYPVFTTAQSSTITLENGRHVVLLGTNSYLGAAKLPEVVEAAKQAIDLYGTGCSGSPLLNGTLSIHKALEEELAVFMHKEAAILCSTGFQTNLAGISGLCGPDDTIIMDERSHRSLFDAAKLSGATYYTYAHNNMEALERVLSRLPHKRKLIVTDTVFSMEGTLADLKGIVALAQKYNARTYVDEAHATGVIGFNGRGVCELFGVEDKIDLVMCTFSKSFASIGGFIAGKRDVIDYIKHNASPHIFSASMPPSAIATVRAVLKIIRERPEYRTKIVLNAEYMARSLKEIGYDARFSGSQIVPVVFGSSILGLAAYKKFMEEGVFVNPVQPPAVPEKDAGFRTSFIASHTLEDIDLALSVFEKLYPDFEKPAVR